ncbi:MAG: AAA family ATPase [Dehalococcoidales bacterium]|nr:AAA family ATPase [Dehalococcoidales bacterium]
MSLSASSGSNQYIYPFTAIVGQEMMKKALILNVINPMIGGVLIRGEKGTAKSTAVRSLAELLPERDSVEGCDFNCDPDDPARYCEYCLRLAAEKPLSRVKTKVQVINLPLSATEDRIAGTLDIEHAIKKGEKRFEPGILAQANRNILYVDEVNLLDDHLVDILLDAAAMGINVVEREGVSFMHPSRFVLVGTMNPEEGNLRPQLTDRFGLVVDVTGEDDIPSRIEIIRRRLAFENDPEAFITDFAQAQQELTARIEQAKDLLKEVHCADDMLNLAARIAIRLEVDGHRADITMIKTAMAHAALEGRREVTEDDLITAARLCLPHRMRRRPFDEGLNPDEIEKIIREVMQKI